MEQRYGSCAYNHAAKKGVTVYDGCQRFTPSPANATVCLCLHGTNYHTDLVEKGSGLDGGQTVSLDQAGQNVCAFANESGNDPAETPQGLKAGGSELEAERVLDAGRGNAAGRQEQLDFGQLPDDFEPPVSNQGLPGKDGELQKSEHLLPRGEVEAGDREAELRVRERDVGVEESDRRGERTGLRREGMELTLKEVEPAEERLGSAAREHRQGTGNVGVPEPPTTTRKRPRMLRELESRMKLNSPEDTVSFVQGQGQEDQTTSPISKRGRPRGPPSQWWGNQIGALWPSSEKKALGKRRKGVKASKSPNQRSSNAAVPDAQRCNRSDGKKWRCSNQRVSGRKVCEKHRR